LRQDYSAIAVAERASAVTRRFDSVNWATREVESEAWVVRHLERIPLGTPYTAVTERVASLAQRPPLAGKCGLVVDGVDGVTAVAVRAGATAECAAAADGAGQHDDLALAVALAVWPKKMRAGIRRSGFCE
jgi:hypothetical protein